MTALNTVRQNHMSLATFDLGLQSRAALPDWSDYCKSSKQEVQGQLVKIKYNPISDGDPSVLTNAVTSCLGAYKSKLTRILCSIFSGRGHFCLCLNKYEAPSKCKRCVRGALHSRENVKHFYIF